MRPDHTSTATLQFAQTALAAQPFSRLVGTRVTEFGDGAATLELDVRDDLRQQHGFVHGGVVAYLVDNAITFAAGTALGPNVVTGGFTVDYLRPATGALLRARAEVVRTGRSQAVMRCDVNTVAEDGSTLVCAVGQGRVSVRPGDPGASAE